MVDRTSPAALADRLDAGEDLTLVDTRPEDAFDAWHLSGATNVPYHPNEGLDDETVERVRERADGDAVVAICGKGLTSTGFAFDLEARGVGDVTVVEGGMAGWSELTESVPIETDDEDLVVRQVQRRGTGCLGYVVGSAASGAGVVVDPTRLTDAFVVAAAEADLRIEGVLDTHVHADHVSGGPGLAERLDVPYYLGAEAAERGVERSFRPMADGDVLDLGGVAIEALHLPGHTSELVAYRVGDEVVLTADALFVDSVGRTELQFGDAGAAEGARLLHESLHERLLALPDETTVLPGHVSVAADGEWAGGEPGEPVAARLGDLRERLDLLALDEDDFVERLTADASEKPANYERIVAINAGREAVESEGELADLELGPNNCAA